MCHPAITDDFYSLLRGAVSSVAKRDELWILDDFNAKVVVVCLEWAALLAASPNT